MAESEDGAVTLKSFQSHLIKTIIGSAIGSIGLGLITGLIFYFNAKNELSNHEAKINEITVTINEHTSQLNKMSGQSGVNDVQVNNLNARMSSLEQNQKEMYGLLIQIASDQKTLLKK